ncbi:hypothetical protein [Kitasatospora indigofera]|uniref:hypothetical protein n=1 Tax=Kitasatospora indigofera TaxID=67307 RepID=UPI0033A7BF8A
MMAGSGLDGTAQMEAFALLSGFVAQFADWERSTAGGGHRQTELGACLYAAATGGDHPNLARTMAEGGAPSTVTPSSGARCTG